MAHVVYCLHNSPTRCLRVDVVVDPRHELGDICVDSGQAGSRAADAPADQADEGAPAALVEGQGAATVPLRARGEAVSGWGIRQPVGLG